ncbi:uncharacterized protein LOC122052074 isoform X1 [Zingiber officinale]|uniref:uncharacterized protein LOC122052074 isoform X1 n=1 Tax=Zingiber officinale TaxID=94328 RepID=UPI001C4A8499|nr:uncharacterized protein LOC122052074 isoform X1 [Zingiber officinale]
MYETTIFNFLNSAIPALSIPKNIILPSSILRLMSQCKIKVPHPRYPSARVSVQVPNLCVHFSSERYFRIMELMGILHGSSKIIEQNLDAHLQSGDKPWHPVDLATNARTLVWQVQSFVFFLTKSNLELLLEKNCKCCMILWNLGKLAAWLVDKYLKFRQRVKMD